MRTKSSLKNTIQLRESVQVVSNQSRRLLNFNRCVCVYVCARVLGELPCALGGEKVGMGVWRSDVSHLPCLDLPRRRNRASIINHRPTSLVVDAISIRSFTVSRIRMEPIFSPSIPPPFTKISSIHTWLARECVLPAMEIVDNRVWKIYSPIEAQELWNS